MKARCYYNKIRDWHLYGWRWITVCDEWKSNFNSFEKFCMENGWAKGKQIDRIDNDWNYCPENCRFVPPKENARNRRTNKYIEYNGMNLTHIWWAEYIGISKETFKSRLKKGFPIEKIINIWKRTWKEFWVFRRTSPVFNMSVWDEIIVNSKRERDSIYASWFIQGIKIKTRKNWNEYKLTRIS